MRYLIPILHIHYFIGCNDSAPSSNSSGSNCPVIIAHSLGTCVQSSSSYDCDSFSSGSIPPGVQCLISACELDSTRSVPLSSCLLSCESHAQLSASSCAQQSKVIGGTDSGWLCIGSGDGYSCSNAVRCRDLIQEQRTYTYAASCSPNPSQDVAAHIVTTPTVSVTCAHYAESYFSMCISSLVTGVSACVGESNYGYKCSDVSRCTDNENGVVYHKSNSCTSCSSTITDVSGTAVYSCQLVPGVSGWGPNGPGCSCSINGINTNSFFCKYKDACDIYYGCSAGCVQTIHGTDCEIAPTEDGFALGQSLSCGVFTLGSLAFGETGIELSRNICGSNDWRQSMTGLTLQNFNKFCYDMSLVDTNYPVVAGGCHVSLPNNEWFELTDIATPLSFYQSVSQVV